MIRCIAIDDESLALELLEDNIRRTPFLRLVKSFTSGFEALEFLRQETVDLIFLDIRMPDLTGLQLLKVLRPKPLVIMITAYEKYALEGFELDVVDYLLKPVSYERFLKAVSKARELIMLRRAATALTASGEPPPLPGHLFVKSDYKQVRIDIAGILYIEGLKDYIKIYSGPTPVITQMSLKTVAGKLPQKDFMRVHRSYIINIHRIQYVQRMHIRVGNKDIPIGENFRDAFFSAINMSQNPT
jgi:two-component system LytT family response regulator